MSIVRAPDGEWASQKESNADALLFREAGSFREHHIACAKSYFSHGRIKYCMRAPRGGRGKKDDARGGILKERRMGKGREATAISCIIPIGIRIRVMLRFVSFLVRHS